MAGAGTCEVATFGCSECCCAIEIGCGMCSQGRVTFGGGLVRNARFGDLTGHFWSKPKHMLWRLDGSLLEEVSSDMLVLNRDFGRTFGLSLQCPARVFYKSSPTISAGGRT